MDNPDGNGFPKLSAPARRALSGAGYARLDQLAQVSESELKRLHGMGPSAIRALRQALDARGLSFRDSVPARPPRDPARPPRDPARPRRDSAAPRAEEVERYLRALEEPKRSTLQTLRRTIMEIVPEAEQVISYGVPAFRVRGATVAGFAAFKTHLSYLPFSGSVLGPLADQLEGYTMTKSALHFPVDRPLPKALVSKLIATRLAELR